MFHAGNFARVPVKLISVTLQEVYKASHQRTNAASVSTAKLAMIVMSALGGAKGKISLDQFLPYDIDDSVSSLKPSTKAALEWALKNEKMPPAVIGMIGAELG